MFFVVEVVAEIWRLLCLWIFSEQSSGDLQRGRPCLGPAHVALARVWDRRGQTGHAAPGPLEWLHRYREAIS